jgi:hypothetical protein
MRFIQYAAQFRRTFWGALRKEIKHQLNFVGIDLDSDLRH